MSTKVDHPTEVDASHAPLSMFYLSAENEDGNDLSLIVVATAETTAVDLWCSHYFEKSEPVAEHWATYGQGVMALALATELEQGHLEPGPIDWALEPFHYLSN